MTNTALQPAIDALEADLVPLERQVNALVTTINVLRAKAGMPPRPTGGGGHSHSDGPQPDGGGGGTLTSIHSDSFLGKRMGSAVREYLTMRKTSGGDAPATVREIFDSLKKGGYAFGSKDDDNAIIVLRAMLRKNTAQYHKLENGKYGLRAWYPHLPKPRGNAAEADDDGDTADASDAALEKKTPKKAAA